MKRIFGGMILATAFKLIYYIFSTTIKFIANVMVFFGLYIPFFYLIWGEILLLFTDFHISPYNTDLGLYLFGLVLSLFCSVIISIRTIIIKPFKALFGRDEKFQEHYAPPQYISYEGHGDFPRPPKRLKPRTYRSEEYGTLRIDKPKEFMDRYEHFHERPEIYRSEVEPDLIIYEYSNRFDLYTLNDSRLEFIETQFR